MARRISLCRHRHALQVIQHLSSAASANECAFWEAYLGIELDEGGAQAHEAREEGLVQVAVALEGHILHHGGQLVVVPDERHPLQPAAPVLGFLHGQRVC